MYNVCNWKKIAEDYSIIIFSITKLLGISWGGWKDFWKGLYTCKKQEISFIIHEFNLDFWEDFLKWLYYC